MVSRDTRAPKTRPVLPRTSSAASGLRFCGIMLDPVVQRSGRRTKPNGADIQTMISSARRDRCTDADRGGRDELDQAVPVRDGVEGIPGRSVEPQRRRGHVPVDGKGCPREGSGAERGFVQPGAGIAKAAAVAAEHLHVGHQVMPEGHGLGALKVGEAGHDGRRVRLGLVEKSLDQGRDLLLRPVMGLANPQTHVDGDLVVAAAGGVQAGRGFTRRSLSGGSRYSCEYLPRPLE